MKALLVTAIYCYDCLLWLLLVTITLSTGSLILLMYTVQLVFAIHDDVLHQTQQVYCIIQSQMLVISFTLTPSLLGLLWLILSYKHHECNKLNNNTFHRSQPPLNAPLGRA